jgi:galactoside O-acetyltransferase
MSLREEIKDGRLYYPDEEGLLAEQRQYMLLLKELNGLGPDDGAKKSAILKELFAEIGKDCYVETPLYCNWGKNVHFGNRVYANFCLTLVDDADIFVGDDVMFGPNVIVATAGHPVWPELRRKGAQYNVPVKIGNNVWVGAGAIILPGVTVGDDSVIGAGSVVTKDIPAGVVAVGNPCKVLREINEKDKEFYYKDRKIGDFK